VAWMPKRQIGTEFRNLSTKTAIQPLRIPHLSISSLFLAVAKSQLPTKMYIESGFTPLH